MGACAAPGTVSAATAKFSGTHYSVSPCPIIRLVLVRQRYFFTAEIAENAENGELPWVLLSRSPVAFVPFACFLPFSAFSGAAAVKSRVVGLAGRR